MKHLLWMVVIGMMVLATNNLFAREAIKTVTIGEHRELRVNDKPFFPIMSWAQDAHRYPKLRSLGFNTFMGPNTDDMDEYLAAVQAADGYGGPAYSQQVAGHPAVLLYAQNDEPDLGINKPSGPRVPIEQTQSIYRNWKASDSTRPVFLNFTGYFLDIDTPWHDTAVSPSTIAYYQKAAQATDVASFDIYPIYQRNAHDKLYWVADGVSKLRQYAGSKRPVFAWIETSKGSKWITYSKQKDVLPHITRAEVWMAIMRGATGIGYFTHAWQPVFAEFRPTAAMQAELKRTNEQITRLAPVILSKPVDSPMSISFENGLKGEVVGRRYQSSLYLFASNLDMQQRVGQATIKVEELKAGQSIEVVDEGRKITAESGQFTDVFGELEVHIYKIQ